MELRHQRVGAASRRPTRYPDAYPPTQDHPTPADEELEVTELVPGRRLVLVGDIGPLHGTVSYDLERTADGTRLANTAELDASGPLRLAAPLFAGRVRAAVAENLATLKDILEAGRP